MPKIINLPSLPHESANRALLDVYKARDALIFGQEALFELLEETLNEVSNLDTDLGKARRLLKLLSHKNPSGPSDNEALKVYHSLQSLDEQFKYEVAKWSKDHIPSLKETEIEIGPETSESARKTLIALGEVELPPDALGTGLGLLNRLSNERSRSHLLLTSLLISAVSQFESFIGQLVSSSLRFSPSELSVERKWGIDEIRSYGSVDALVDKAIIDKVDSLMHESLSDWLDFLQKSLKNTDLIWVRNSLIEIFERRHLHTHNGGKVNKRYLRLVVNTSFVEEKELIVDANYLREALDALLVAGVYLSQLSIKLITNVVEHKGESEENLPMDHNSMDWVTLRLIKAERYAPVIEMFKRSHKDVLEEGVLEAFRVNHFQARKAVATDKSKVLSDIKKWNTNAKASYIQLGKLCLLDRNEEALTLLSTVMSEGRVDQESLRTWPLFSGLRDYILEQNIIV